MKYKHIVASILLCQACCGQQIEKASSIAPEDLGAHKWILSGTALENQVVIFRQSTVKDWDNRVMTDIKDTVCYSHGGKETFSVFFIDPKYFDTTRVDEPKWYLQALGSTDWIEGRFERFITSDKMLEITFASKKLGKTTKKYQVFIKSYEEASMLYDGLPKINPDIGWRWSGSPKAQSEQGGADQPTTAPELESEGKDKPQPQSEVTPR